MVSVIVLNFRSAERTIHAARSAVASLGDTKHELIVVDNASGDGSPEAIRTALPACTVVETDANLGFARAMNAGIGVASGDCILLLNSDIEAVGDSAAVLVKFVREHIEVGLAAPLLVDSAGRTTRSVLIEPTFWRVLVPWIGKLRDREWRRRVADVPLDVEATEGAAVLVSRRAIEEAGLLDGDFFFYHEIVEWCMRIRGHGFRVVLLPAAGMIHGCGESTKHLRAAKIELKRSEYQLLEKRFGRVFVRCVILRDIVLEALTSVFYSVGYAFTLGRSRRFREKFSVHAALLGWLSGGMPGRADGRYINRFGGWD